MKKIILILSIAVILFLSGCTGTKNTLGPLGSAHNHADIKVYTLGKQIDFSLPKYQLQDKAVHFEDHDDDVVHLHATGITLNYIFRTLRMNIDDECLTIDTGNKYCSKDNAKLKVFVKNIETEWKEIFSHADYIPQNKDKILITYGTENQEDIQKQMDTVTDKSE
jgi:hypothetical protein